MPTTLKEATKNGKIPYLPIHPISYRKEWQYDDEAYNFIYDYLSAFSEFNFPEELQQTLNNTRIEVATEYKTEELFEILLQSATSSNFRRFQSIELEKCFEKRVEDWKKIKEDNKEFSDSNINEEPSL